MVYLMVIIRRQRKGNRRRYTLQFKYTVHTELDVCTCTLCTLQVMADIVSSLLDEKNAPAFEATDKVELYRNIIIILSNCAI